MCAARATTPRPPPPTARHAIRVLSHWNGDPAQVLRGANEIMLTEEFGSRFVTADAAHLSWQDGALQVVLSSAGHPGPVLLKPDGRAQMLAGGGVALGIFPDPEPATQELELNPGDVLFFFTDGLTGARSPQLTYLEDILTDSLAGLAGQARRRHRGGDAQDRARLHCRRAARRPDHAVPCGQSLRRLTSPLCFGAADTR